MSEEKKVPHVKAFEGQTFVISVLVSVFSAVICMQIISRIGTTPNTSVIGALFAMALARIPFASLGRFRSLDRQNLVQTMASAAGFGRRRMSNQTFSFRRSPHGRRRHCVHRQPVGHVGSGRRAFDPRLLSEPCSLAQFSWTDESPGRSRENVYPARFHDRRWVDLTDSGARHDLQKIRPRVFVRKRAYGDPRGGKKSHRRSHWIFPL